MTLGSGLQLVLDRLPTLVGIITRCYSLHLTATHNWTPSGTDEHLATKPIFNCVFLGMYSSSPRTSDASFTRRFIHSITNEIPVHLDRKLERSEGLCDRHCRCHRDVQLIVKTKKKSWCHAFTKRRWRRVPIEAGVVPSAMGALVQLALLFRSDVSNNW